MLAVYRTRVIADPSSHPEHAAEAHRLLILPSGEDIAASVSRLDPAALLMIRAYVAGEPIPCTCSTTIAPACSEPAPVEVEPAIVVPTEV